MFLCCIYFQSFVFHTRQSEALHIAVYDKDVVGKDDFLGRVCIMLSSLVRVPANEYVLSFLYIVVHSFVCFSIHNTLQRSHTFLRRLTITFVRNATLQVHQVEVDQWLTLQHTSTGRLHVKITALDWGLPLETPPQALDVVEEGASKGKSLFRSKGAYTCMCRQRAIYMDMCMNACRRVCITHTRSNGLCYFLINHIVQFNNQTALMSCS